VIKTWYTDSTLSRVPRTDTLPQEVVYQGANSITGVLVQGSANAADTTRIATLVYNSPLAANARLLQMRLAPGMPQPEVAEIGFGFLVNGWTIPAQGRRPSLSALPNK
jgi:hypothetical protein